MFELKRLSKEGVGAAIRKAEHYRLLNEPRAAESICLDVLEVEPGNQEVLVLLLLSRTDQFVKNLGSRVQDARALISQIEGEYEKAYYSGIVCERWAKAQLTLAHPGSGSMAFDGLREAMQWYEKAQELRRPGNDDAILRWNACVRLIERHDQVRPGHVDQFHPLLE